MCHEKQEALEDHHIQLFDSLVRWLYCTHAAQTHSTHTHTHTHTRTAYSQLLCSGSRDNSVSLWDANTGKSISSMYAPRNLVTDLKWIAGEKAVVQSSEDKTLRVWDLRTCSTVQHFRARNYLQVWLCVSVCVSV